MVKFETFCIMAALLLPGCSSQDSEREASLEVVVPGEWASGEKDQKDGVELGWLHTFEDPEMESFVYEALAHSPNFKIAAARLRLAEEGMIVARAPRLPTISASGSASGGGVRTRDGSGSLRPWVHGESYSLSMNVSWEIDLWGRLRNLHQASIEDYTAQAEDYRGARLSLAASTAKAWCNLIAARQQVELRRETRDSFVQNFNITEGNYRAGDPSASPLDVQFGRNNVASAERALILSHLARDDARRILETLVGRYPAAAIEGRDDLPRLANDVPAGLPSELLMRRPDLAAAAADLRATAERADAAKKNLLPSIRLNGNGSTGSAKLADFVANPGSLAWSVAGSISQPIFQGGALKAQARQAMIANEVAVQSFAGIALQAFREVESAIDREQSLVDQEAFLIKETTQAVNAESQALRDYTEGIVSILALLEAQRRAFNARSSMISLQNQRLQNRIDLHLALGGDFETPDEHPEAELPDAELPGTEPSGAELSGAGPDPQREPRLSLNVEDRTLRENERGRDDEPARKDI